MTVPLTIAQAAALIAARKLSPVELAQSCLARIEKLDGTLHAFIRLTPDRVLAEAQAAEARIMKIGPLGPLHGIPIAHKDIYCTKGIPTTAHSKILIDHVPAEDAVTVRRLAEAGTVMLGKLATHEFACDGPSFDLPWPPARNPWNPAHDTGGSSSGTGAAVAAGLVLGGTGSDTGGSIRGPASLCGVAGFKPTYGLCPRTGILPLAYSLDHVGPLAWTVEDCAIMLQPMVGPDAGDPASAHVQAPDFRASLFGSVKGMRIGFVRHFHELDFRVNDATRRALEDAASVFHDLGAEVVEVTLPPLADWTACAAIILMAESYALHEKWVKSRPQDYGEWSRDHITMGAFLSAADYVEAQRMRRELCAAFDETMCKVDVLLCATTPGEAPPIERRTKGSSFELPWLNCPFNVRGAPALAVCTGFTAAGLPLGMQLVGRPFEDATVLRAGHHYEKATPWRDKDGVEKSLPSVRGNFFWFFLPGSHHAFVGLLDACDVTSFPFADFLDPIVPARASLAVGTGSPSLQSHLPEFHRCERWPRVSVVLPGRQDVPDHDCELARRRDGCDPGPVLFLRSVEECSQRTRRRLG